MREELTLEALYKGMHQELRSKQMGTRVCIRRLNDHQVIKMAPGYNCSDNDAPWGYHFNVCDMLAHFHVGKYSLQRSLGYVMYTHILYMHMCVYF